MIIVEQSRRGYNGSRYVSPLDFTRDVIVKKEAAGLDLPIAVRISTALEVVSPPLINFWKKSNTLPESLNHPKS